MWLIIFALMLLAGLGGVFYLMTRFRKFSFMKKLAARSKLLSWALAAVPILLIGLLSFINFFAALVALIHLAAFWLVCDLAALTIKKLSGREPERYYAGAAAGLFTAAYLSFGWYNAHRVVRTNYSLETSKELGADKLRIVLIADLHVGITLDGDAFAKEMERVEDEKPDLVVIAGDFVDDDSNAEDMKKACEALDIKTTYGVFFCWGNHDKGYYDSRDFTIEEIEDELKKNSVTVLKDESVLVNDTFYVIGRADAYEEERAPISKLMEGLDKSKYSIVLDHQPTDYDAEAEAGADLVLSGHTHGGHIWPAGAIGKLIGANDRVYGRETRSGTDFVVTSGISGWAIPFKTGTKSEYVVIDVEAN